MLKLKACLLKHLFCIRYSKTCSMISPVGGAAGWAGWRMISKSPLGWRLGWEGEGEQRWNRQAPAPSEATHKGHQSSGGHAVHSVCSASLQGLSPHWLPGCISLQVRGTSQTPAWQPRALQVKVTPGIVIHILQSEEEFNMRVL